MSNVWRITGGTLQYSSGGEFQTPSASEIFSAIASSNATNSSWMEEIATSFPALRFSKISSQVHGHFWFENEKINFELLTKRRGQNVTVAFDSTIADHYVFDNTWFYLSNITPELQRCLSKWSSPATTTISVGQYVNLLKQFQANNLII